MNGAGHGKNNVLVRNTAPQIELIKQLKFKKQKIVALTVGTKRNYLQFEVIDSAIPINFRIFILCRKTFFFRKSVKNYSI